MCVCVCARARARAPACLSVCVYGGMCDGKEREGEGGIARVMQSIVKALLGVIDLILTVAMID